MHIALLWARVLSLSWLGLNCVCLVMGPELEQPARDLEESCYRVGSATQSSDQGLTASEVAVTNSAYVCMCVCVWEGGFQPLRPEPK